MAYAGGGRSTDDQPRPTPAGCVVPTTRPADGIAVSGGRLEASSRLLAPCILAQLTSGVVVMGVAGSGKSTLGAALAERMGWAMIEGDDFHSDENKARMHAGVPLSDAD